MEALQVREMSLVERVRRAAEHLVSSLHDGLWHHGSGQYHRIECRRYSSGSQRWHWNACLLEQQHHRGTTAETRNIISGNFASGLWIDGSNNIVRGNYLGVGSDGITSLGNGWDAITVSGNNNLIGGTGVNDRNILANSGDDGIEIAGAGSGNAILGNRIHNNLSMAIDLGGNDSTPTLNDLNDTDSGTNGLQNFPVLTTATTSLPVRRSSEH